MANQRFSRKVFNLCIVIVIIIAIIFTALMLILNYDEKGETNMPFFVSKIYTISTVNGQDVEDNEHKWNINVIQNNDVYLYIEKNKDYSKQEIISYIRLDNIKVKQNPTIGEIKIYKPVQDENILFKNLDENIINEITFSGTKATNTRNLEISNQGGPIAFRCANLNVGKFISNDDEEINFEQLLKKLNVKEDALKATISFDITIALNSKKVYKAENVEISIPNENIVEIGRVGIETTDLKNIIFKRIEN